jgi:hypothetical protein
VNLAPAGDSRVWQGDAPPTSEITDLTTNTSFSHTYTIDIPAFTGGITAFVGFTGGTGALGAVQDVESWTLHNPPPTISGVSVDKPTLWPTLAPARPTDERPGADEDDGSGLVPARTVPARTRPKAPGWRRYSSGLVIPNNPASQHQRS